MPNLFDQLRSDWANNPTLFAIEMGGTLISIVGGVTLVTLPANPPMVLILVLWTIGSTGLLLSSLARKNTWVLVLATYQILANLFGLANLFWFA